jgi:hypothetical protein
LRNYLKSIVKHFDNGVVTISLPYESEEVETAIPMAESKHYKRRIEELAAVLGEHA